MNISQRNSKESNLMIHGQSNINSPSKKTTSKFTEVNDT